MNYGKITFNNNEYCIITLNSNNKTSTYKLNKTDSISLLTGILEINEVFNININEIKNNQPKTIEININNEEKIKAIIELCSKYEVNPKKVRPKKTTKKLIPKILATTAIASIIIAGVVYNYNTKNTKLTITDTPKASQNDYLEDDDDEIAYEYIEPTEEDQTNTTSKTNEIPQIETEPTETKTEEEYQEQEIEPTEENNTTKEEESIPQEEETSTIQYDYTYDLQDISLEDYQYEKYQTACEYYYDYFEKYGNMYGIDPLLLSYIATQERGIHSETIDAGGAIGLCQIQVYWTELNVLNITDYQESKVDVYIDAYTLTCYNFNTQTYDNLLPIQSYSKIVLNNINALNNVITMDLSNVEDNIRVCAAIMANHLKTFNYNIPAAIMAYNQGKGAVNKYIKSYMTATGLSYEEALNSYGWLDYIPNDYGDKNYLNHILRYAIASENNTITISYIDDYNNEATKSLLITGDNIKNKTNTKS